jgi:hypothetical protein
VLGAIDDAIGGKPAWEIPVGQIVTKSGRKRATVMAAIAALNSLYLITVDRNFKVVAGRADQTFSTYRICWSNLLDYVPDRDAAQQTRREPQTVSLRRPVLAVTETGGLSLRPEGSQFETHGVSIGDPSGLTVRPEGSQSETLTADLTPLPAKEPPPPPNTAAASGGGKGKLFRGWFDDAALRRAVNNRQRDVLRKAFDELGRAVEFQIFAARAFDAVQQAQKSPVGLLAVWVRNNEIVEEAATTPALKWASALCSETPVATAPAVTTITALSDEDRAKADAFRSRLMKRKELAHV